MLIAIIDFATTPADRDAAILVLQAEAPIVRALPGNLDYSVHLDPENAGGIHLMHEWSDAASFAAYRESDGFKAVGAMLFPKMVGKPSTRVFDATMLIT